MEDPQDELEQKRTVKRKVTEQEESDAIVKQKKLRMLNVSAGLDADEVEIREDPFVGTTIAGKYQILTQLGKGGMSTVYKARNTGTQRMVAVKIMHAHLLSDQNSARRFHQEAKAASRLTHPNAISIYDVGTTDSGQPYLIMEYLRGVSLDHEITEQGRINANRAAHIFMQAVAAVENAHQCGIIHRDLKPSNIMLMNTLNDPDFVKIVDFGIAKILPQGEGESLRLTGTGEIFGSPLYMSPEQCRGEQLDARSDIYSMGCVMYETITGVPPFRGGNVMETMMLHTTESPPPVRDVQGDPVMVDHFQKIVFKCLSKNPEQRFQSMAELRHALEVAEAASSGKLNITVHIAWMIKNTIRRVTRLLQSAPRVPLLAVMVGLLALASGMLVLWPGYLLLFDPPASENTVTYRPAALLDPMIHHGNRKHANTTAWMESWGLMAFGDAYKDYIFSRKEADGLYSTGHYPEAIEAYKDVFEAADRCQKRIGGLKSTFKQWEEANNVPTEVTQGFARAGGSTGQGNASGNYVLPTHSTDGSMLKMGLEGNFMALMDIVRMLPRSNLSDSYLQTGKYEEALPLLDAIWKFVEPTAQSSYPIMTFETFVKKAYALDHIGKSSEADEYMAKAMTYWERANRYVRGKDWNFMEEQAAVCIDRVAQYYVKRGNLKDALQWYGTEKEYWMDQQSAHNVAAVENRIGLLQLIQAQLSETTGDPQEAKEHLLDAASSFKTAAQTIDNDPNKAEVARVLVNLSNAQWKCGDWWTALQTRARARTLWMASGFNLNVPKPKTVEVHHPKHTDDELLGF